MTQPYGREERKMIIQISRKLRERGQTSLQITLLRYLQPKAGQLRSIYFSLYMVFHDYISKACELFTSNPLLPLLTNTKSVQPRCQHTTGH